MKRPESRLERLFQWIDKHAMVAVFSFATGAVFTALAAQGEAWVEFFGILTALGTLAAAVAALVATAATRAQMQQQLERESEEKSPNVRVTNTVFTEAYYIQGKRVIDRRIAIEIANMSAAPLLVTEVHVWDDQKPMPTYEPTAVIIQPGGEANTGDVSFPVYPLEGGHVSIYFQYSATGPVLHRLTVPYRLLAIADRYGGSKTVERFEFPFDLNDQRLESGSMAKANLEQVHQFWKENPVQVLDVRPSSTGTGQEADSSAGG